MDIQREINKDHIGKITSGISSIVSLGLLGVIGISSQNGTRPSDGPSCFPCISLIIIICDGATSPPMWSLFIRVGVVRNFIWGGGWTRNVQRSIGQSYASPSQREV